MAGRYNIVEFEEDPFKDVDADDFTNENLVSFYSVLSYFSIVTDLIKLVLCLCVIGCDVILVMVIRKNKKLNTKINSYIKHYAIFSIISLVAMPVFSIITELTSAWKYLGFMKTYCFIYQLEASSMLFCFLFAMGLALEWLFTIHNPSLGQRFERFHKYSLQMIYTVGILQHVVMNGFCFVDVWYIRHIFGKVVFLGSIIFLGVCNYYARNKTESSKKDYALSISNIMLFAWVPLYIYDFLLSNFYGEILNLILYFTCFIPEWLAYGSPIIIVLVLGKLNKHFQMAYDRLFKKSVRNYDGEDGETFESEDEAPIENSIDAYNTAANI